MVPIVSINYNGSKDTIALIESLKESKDSFDFIIVDNNSPDPADTNRLYNYLINNYTLEDKSSYEAPCINKIINFSINFNSRITFIKALDNYGFSKGTNIGLKYAEKMYPKEKYYAILNNDTIVTEHFLNNIIEKMEKYELSAAMSTILYYGYDKPYIWSIGGNINWIRGESVHISKNSIFEGNDNEVVYREFISGCFTVFNSEALKSIGFLDEDYFFAGEEYQYSYDLIKRGLKIAWIPSSIIYHKSILGIGNGSSHTISDLCWQYNAYMVKILFVNKNKDLLFRLFWHIIFKLYIDIKIRKKYLNDSRYGSQSFLLMRNNLFLNINSTRFTKEDFFNFKNKILCAEN